MKSKRRFQHFPASVAKCTGWLGKSRKTDGPSSAQYLRSRSVKQRCSNTFYVDMTELLIVYGDSGY